MDLPGPYRRPGMREKGCDGIRAKEQAWNCKEG